MVATVFLLAIAFSAGAVCAKENRAGMPLAASDTDSLQQDDASTKVFSLGNFYIRQLKPTRNETISVYFALYLVLPDGSSLAAEKQLEKWTHRLRDQVLTSVRLAETKDFTEPKLERLRRLILLRINRILKSMQIEDMYITQFEFSLHS